jgi:hypothetical protein
LVGDNPAARRGTSDGSAADASIDGDAAVADDSGGLALGPAGSRRNKAAVSPAGTTRGVTDADVDTLPDAGNRIAGRGCCTTQPPARATTIAVTSQRHEKRRSGLGLFEGEEFNRRSLQCMAARIFGDMGNHHKAAFERSNTACSGQAGMRSTWPG